jgi:hypothetical protein
MSLIDLFAQTNKGIKTQKHPILIIGNHAKIGTFGRY